MQTHSPVRRSPSGATQAAAVTLALLAAASSVPRAQDAARETAFTACGVGAVPVAGGANNDFLFFEGEPQFVARTFVNAYSGAEVFIEGEYRVNRGAYDGGAGVDTLFLTDVGDMICLEGDDGVQLLRNVERIFAGDGSDVVNLAHPAVVLGNLFLDGGRGDDVLWGNAGDDTIRGFDGNDFIDGGPGNDSLHGQAGADLVLGGDGDDSLGFGREVLLGGADHAVNHGTPAVPGTGELVPLEGLRASRDVWIGGPGHDVLAMEADTVLFLWDEERDHHPLATPLRLAEVEEILLASSLQPSRSVVNLTHPVHAYGDVIVRSGTGDDVIWTSDGNDTIHLEGGNNSVWTGGGADLVHGGPGDDVINVDDGTGDDVVYCGDGLDVVYANPGDYVHEDCEIVHVLAHDTVPPAVTVSLSVPDGQAGWHVSLPVVVVVHATDPSGVAEFSCTVGGWPVHVGNLTGVGTSSAGGSFEIVADGVWHVACDAIDGLGHSGAQAGSSNAATARIDTTPPVITITAPADGASFVEGEAAAASYSCTDQQGLSGVATCVGPVPTGAQIDTATPGVRQFAVTASDAAGNTATLIHGYTVAAPPPRYTFIGFFSPVRNDVTNVVSAGRAIPLKWQVHDQAGDLVLDPAVVRRVGYTQAPCVSESVENPLDGLADAAGASELQIVGTEFQLNWKTDRGFAGACLQLAVELEDASVHTARFRFVR